MTDISKARRRPLDHKLSYPYQGLDQRLIGPTDEARIIKDLLA